MAYSCAYWTATTGQQDLDGAQQAKLDLICRKLGLEPGMRLLDVGCGWGSLTLHAARAPGPGDRRDPVRASRAATSAARRRGLGLGRPGRGPDRRTTATRWTRPFDAVASIEMGEHVGERQYPAFCAGPVRAAEAGRPAADPADVPEPAPPPAAARSSSPTSPPTCTCARSARPSSCSRRPGSRSATSQAMREHYVRTVRAWLETFERNLPAIDAIADRRTGPRLAAVPGRRRAGLRGGPDGRRPDPGRKARHGDAGSHQGRSASLWSSPPPRC